MTGETRTQGRRGSGGRGSEMIMMRSWMGPAMEPNRKERRGGGEEHEAEACRGRRPSRADWGARRLGGPLGGAPSPPPTDWVAADWVGGGRLGGRALAAAKPGPAAQGGGQGGHGAADRVTGVAERSKAASSSESRAPRSCSHGASRRSCSPRAGRFIAIATGDGPGMAWSGPGADSGPEFPAARGRCQTLPVCSMTLLITARRRRPVLPAHRPDVTPPESSFPSSLFAALLACCRGLRAVYDVSTYPRFWSRWLWNLVKRLPACGSRSRWWVQFPPAIPKPRNRP
jgi:hypothetical protein